MSEWNRVEGPRSFAFSDEGTLVYVDGPNRAVSELVQVDRRGVPKSLNLPKRSYGEFKISPDGKKIAVLLGDEKDDLWIHNSELDSWSRFTVEGNNSVPVWSPDGTQLIYTSMRNDISGVYRKNLDGSGGEEQLTQAPKGHRVGPIGLTSDANYLFLTGVPGELQVFFLDHVKSAESRPYLTISKNVWFVSLSPDSRWLTYTSDHLGPWEVFVEDFPRATQRWKVSLDGGEESRWSVDGKELFYRNKDKWFVVPIDTTEGFKAGKPTVLFEGSYINVYGYSWDVYPDGQRFLVLRPGEQKNPRQIRIILNWFEELKQKVPVGK